MTDKGFYKIEMEVLSRIAEENPSITKALKDQLKVAVVKARENSGAGFFTAFDVDKAAAGPIQTTKPLGNTIAHVSGFTQAMGFVLFFDGGYAQTLEGFTYGEDDTSEVDFSTVDFTVEPR